MDTKGNFFHDLDVMEEQMSEHINNAISEITQQAHESFQKLFMSLKNTGTALDESVRKNVSKVRLSAQNQKLGNVKLNKDIALEPKVYSDQQKCAKDASNAAQILLRKIAGQKYSSRTRNEKEEPSSVLHPVTQPSEDDRNCIGSRVALNDAAQQKAGIPCEEPAAGAEANHLLEADTQGYLTNEAYKVVGQIILHVVDGIASNTKSNVSPSKVRGSKRHEDGDNSLSSPNENASSARKRMKRDSGSKEAFDAHTNIEAPKAIRHEKKTSIAADQVSSRITSDSSPVKVFKKFKCGDIVWAFWNHRWYAAKVSKSQDVPMEQRGKLDHMYKRQKAADYILVRFFVDGAFSKVHRSKVDILGSSNIDRMRSKNDVKSYAKAFDELKNKNSLNKDSKKPKTVLTQTSGVSKKKATKEATGKEIDNLSERKRSHPWKKNAEEKSNNIEKVTSSSIKNIKKEAVVSRDLGDKIKDSKVRKEKLNKEKKVRSLQNQIKIEEKSYDLKNTENDSSNTHGEEMKEDDLVIATVRGRKPWPAKVTEVLEGGVCKVNFYGTQNVNYSGGKVYPTKIVKYSSDSKQVLYKFKSDKMLKAIEEITVDLMSRCPN